MILKFNKIKALVLASLFAASLLFVACSNNTTKNNVKSNTTNNQNSRLEIVKDRGKLICGISGKLPGLSFIDSKGKYSGLDVDICRVVAAAIFNDADKVEFRVVSTTERFNALNSGEIDLLAANTTWTKSRDAGLKVAFVPTIFYDGQGIMAKLNSNIDRLEDLDNKTICVLSGTTSLLNLEDQLATKAIDYQPLAFSDSEQSYNAYLQGRCQAITSDRSQLIGRRSRFPNPNNHRILEVTLSKEPLSPAVKDDDMQWFDIVRWSIFSTIQAEEFGITSENIDNFNNTDNPAIKRFLGIEGSLSKNLGLERQFSASIVKKVGNYAEIYDRNIGKPFGLDRDLNALWLDGGLMYSPPFR